MSYGRHRLESCPARLRLVGWATPEGTAHVVYRGVSRVIPPTLGWGELVAVLIALDEEVN